MKPIKLYKDLSIPLYIGETDIKRRVSPTPPTPITYLTNWKIVGNSEVHDTEIWSCGEYNPIDGKWHILVQPLGGSIADIALTEPLRKVNDVVDTIEFPSSIEGKALVTRIYTQAKVRDLEFERIGQLNNRIRFRSKILETKHYSVNAKCNILFDQYICMSILDANTTNQPYVIASYVEQLYLYCPLDIDTNDKFNEQYGDEDIIYELVSPTTELINIPQIAEADSYSCVISQGGKAVSWSSFITD